ncbi:hypothetical protein LCGC14_0738400 [marine sediment metagenome]|uniref:Uncharacterized protein n=1 Tax=marine sediment metagenome TaxID=412755 RepID=A0A0F9QBM3_9ZZZZ
MPKFYVGDTPLLRVDAGSDISDASVYRILYWKPDGASGYFVGSLSGTQLIEYQITDVTILDEKGAWKFASFIALANGLMYTGETFEQQIFKRGR